MALTPEDLLEVLSVYSALEQAIPAVAATPGWYVVGAFSLRVSYDVRFQVIASVSDASLTLNARLFDMSSTPPAPVAGVLSLQDLVDAVRTSQVVSLTGGHLYQMQVEVVGDAGEDFFGSLKSMQLVA
jgi:hypothetical protein